MESEVREDPKESSNKPSTSKNIIESGSGLEHSDGELEIDLTLSPQKASSPMAFSSKNELDIIETIEDEIGKQLTEKAEKSNLTVSNVKSIIKQVLTNEHVQALLGKGENDKAQISSYEPKLTRAKAKELMSSNPIQVPPVPIPWVRQPPSETHVLIGEDLKEDDSGDEYVPGEEESEDDRDESVASESDISSLPPPTPPTLVSTEDQSTQTTTYTDDGVFKLPLPKTAQEEAAEEAANIALRTRSKINLSSTPLEVIEKSFVPPDITTDMYDMDCDDDEWRDFLKGFTEPLEEVTKPTEDEEHDPEYNILADDQINHVDNEDFRVDKAVKITKKEVKELWEELFEYIENVSEEYGDNNKDKSSQQVTANSFVENSFGELLVNENNSAELPDKESNSQNIDTTNQASCKEGSDTPSSLEKSQQDTATLFRVELDQHQLYLMEQQMRQHVQMLTQNFLLTYEHPEFHQYSTTLKEYLLNLRFLSEGKTYSLFKPINLIPALKLTDDWINLCASNCEEITKTREYVQQELSKSIQYKMAGNWGYIVTFPKLLLETISNSEVFSFPSLLPKIPFKSQQFLQRCGFTDAEDSLLVFAMDDFKSFLTAEKPGKTVTLKEIVSYVQHYLMPHRNLRKILQHIHQTKHPRCSSNPIKEYILHGELKPVMHDIYPLDQIIPPCKRKPEELPHQWKCFIYPKLEENVPQDVINITPQQTTQTIVPQQIILISSFHWANSINLTQTTEVKTSKQRTSKARTSLQDKLNPTVNVKLKLNVKKGKASSRSKAKRKKSLKTSSTSIEFLVTIFLRPVAVQKLVQFLTDIDEDKQTRVVTQNRVFLKVNQPPTSGMFSNIPLRTNENEPEEAAKEYAVTSATDDSAASSSEAAKESATNSKHVKLDTVNSCIISQETKREKVPKSLEFSTITSSSFQKANANREVEFCRNSSDVQICQTSQCDELHGKKSDPSSSGYDSGLGKDNPDDINAPLIASTTVKPPEAKPNVRKELSGAEKKKNKLRKDFLANLTIAAPEDPEIEKHKNEMFAIAYYDKIRETLDLEDYHKIMEVLNDFGSGDVIDLYNDVQAILRPKYAELAEEFLFFLKEKEAYAVGQLIPWLELQARTKFLRKLDIYLKDQPAQLKKIYNTLLDLTKAEDLSMDKVKGVLVPLLKGNGILMDLLLQNFRHEPPPPSLLAGSYETIDLNKELARPDNEDLYETFVVPNTEDQYGGQNCICHCHRIEDNEYKSRYKHCKACGLKFAHGKLYLSAGRAFQPATVRFKTSPHINHNARLWGKSITSNQKKKRPDVSPSKLATSGGKQNLEEDTEDEELSKRKKSISQKNPRKRKKIEPSKYQENCKPASPKKSPVRSNDTWDNQSIKPRKRTYSAKKAKKEDTKKPENEAEKVEDIEVPIEKIVDEECEIIAIEVEESEHETSEEHAEKLTDDCMDSSGESLEKPLTPGQQTAESESEVYLEEESSQDNYETDDSISSTESAKGSQSDSNTNDEPAWKREEDTIILETLQNEDDKEYALQIISDKLPNRTVGQIRSRLSRLMDLLIESLKNT